VTATLGAVLAATSQAIGAGALLAGLVTLAGTRRPALALSVFLDLLVASGLLRLAGSPSWQTIATAASVILLRRLIGFGLRAGGRSWDSPTGRRSDRRGAGRRLANRLVSPAWRR